MLFMIRAPCVSHKRNKMTAAASHCVTYCGDTIVPDGHTTVKPQSSDVFHGIVTVQLPFSYTMVLEKENKA